MARKEVESFTEQLRSAILVADLNQAELARRSGVPKEVLSRFTHGLVGMSLPSIDAICEVLQLRLVGPERKRTRGT